MKKNIAFLLGGGRSVNDLEIDFDVLRGFGPLWGVNEAAFNRDCDAFFTIDRVWTWEVIPVLNKLKCPVHYASKSWQKWPVMPPNAVKWERVLGLPSLIMPKVATGHQAAASSGLSAINALAQLGHNRIYLFGYDMHLSNYDYWFSDKKHPKDNIPAVLENFRYHAPFYQQHNIEVLNVNPTSAIDAFPRISVGDINI